MSDAVTPRGPSALIGQTLAGQFLIEKKLGEGGMGAVFLATQLGMDRRVVVKVMHPELTAGSPQSVLRFQREAKAVAALNHPNIVQVHVFGQSDDGQLYQAMEFIDGRDLGEVMAEGPMKQARALQILAQVAAALADAHAAGITHRDLKPENIMLTARHGNPDWVKVLDFGIAKLHEPEGSVGGKAPATLTQAGAVFGTPAYMAPEQVRGQAVDGRTDLYGLGVMLHEMVTGFHPFEAESPIDFLVRHVSDPVMPVMARFPALGIAPAVAEIIEKLLQKAPGDRIQTANELQAAIQQALAGGGVGAMPAAAAAQAAVPGFTQTPPAGLPGRPDLGIAETVTHVPPERPRRRSSAPLFVALGLVLVGGAAAAIAVLSSGGTDTTASVLAAVGAPVEAPTTLAAVPSETPPAPTPEAAAVVATPEPTPEPDLAAEPAPEPAEAPVVEPTPEEGAAPEPVELEGLLAPTGSTILRSTRAALRVTVPMTPTEIVAFYTDAYPDTTRAIKGGLEFTDKAFPYRSFTVDIEGVNIVVVALRRETARNAVTGHVEPATPRPPRPDPGLTGPITEPKPQPPTQPKPREPAPEPVVVAPTPTPTPEPAPTAPAPKPPVITTQPGQLPTEIALPDGTVIPIRIPTRDLKKTKEEAERTLKDALRNRSLFGPRR